MERMLAFAAWLLFGLSALAAETESQAEALVPAPERSWGVRLAPADFEFGEPVASSDGQTAGVVGDGPRGIVATLTLRPAGEATTTDGCRATADERAGRGAQQTYRLEHDRRGPLALTAYVVSFYRGAAVDQRHVHAFLYRDRYCIELELAMPRYKTRHRHLFDEALDALEVVDLP